MLILVKQEISFKEGIEIIYSKYDNMVNKLRKINEIEHISQNDYLFAKEIVNIPISQRYTWIKSKSRNNETIILLNEIRDDELWKKRQ